MKNARFNVWINDGLVKITLKPGQTLSHYKFERTDEGWHSEAVEWEHGGEGVTRNSYSSGVDCDGRLDCQYEDYCPLSDLTNWEVDGEDYKMPDWQDVRSSQRDHYAEAMNY